MLRDGFAKYLTCNYNGPLLSVWIRPGASTSDHVKACVRLVERAHLVVALRLAGETVARVTRALWRRVQYSGQMCRRQVLEERYGLEDMVYWGVHCPWRC